MAPTSSNNTPLLSKSAKRNMKKRQKKREQKEGAAEMPLGSSSEVLSASTGKMATPAMYASSDSFTDASSPLAGNMATLKLSISPHISSGASSTSYQNATTPLDSEEDINTLRFLAKPLIPDRSNFPWSRMSNAKTDVDNPADDCFAVKSPLMNAWASENGKSTASKLFPSVQPINSPNSPVHLYNEWDVTNYTQCTPSLSSPSTSQMSAHQGWIIAPETEEEKTKRLFDDAVRDWPWTGNPPQMKTLAPWAASGHPWKLEKADNNRECLLFSMLLSVDVIAGLLLRTVFQNHEMTCSFARLCQDSFDIGSAFVHHWDMTHGYFQDCEVPRIPMYEIIKDANLAKKPQGYVRPVVIVTPVRNGEGPAPYVHQVQNLFSTCLAAKNFFDHLQNIQFHRVPFLTTHILELLIPRMWKLEFLGVYNCQLIHIGSALQILHIIVLQARAVVTRNQVRNPHEPVKKKKLIKWDFYPLFHIGPLQIPGTGNGKEYSGSYGCTWDNWDGDSRQAIWCIVFGLLSRVRKERLDHGADLLYKGTAFRKWLEKSPCLLVTETLERMLDPKCPLEEVAAWVRYDKFRGKIARLATHHMFPDNMTWATQLTRCALCKTPTMGIFFKWDAIKWMQNGRETNPTCQGCELEFVLRKEQDHYKNKKRNIIGKWLSKGRDDNNKHFFETKDLEKVLVDFKNREILKSASDLDRCRQGHIADAAQGGYKYDRELNERQLPVSATASNHKVGKRWYSPSIYETVDEACYDRLDAHGVKW